MKYFLVTVLIFISPLSSAQRVTTKEHAPTFFYHLKGNDIYKVFPDTHTNTPITFLEPNTLIPFSGVSQGRAVLKTDKGRNLFVQLNKESHVLDTSKGQKIKVYLDRPEGQSVTMFPEPGMTWHDCTGGKEQTDSRCQQRLWPHSAADTQLYIIDSKMKKIVDPLTGQSEEKLFYQVNGSYVPKKNWQGKRQIENLWIEADDVRPTPLGKSNLALESEEKMKKEIPCPPSKSGVEDRVKDIKEIAIKSKSQLNKDFQQALLKEGVGTCHKKRTQKIPSGIKNPFNKYMKTFWQKKYQKSKNSHLTFNNKQISQQQMFAIDSLARTLFAEMRGCVKKGLRYPMSVARVALNRAYYSVKYAKNKRGKVGGLSFVKDTLPGLEKGEFDYRKAPIDEVLTRVISASKQFSAWNPDDPNLHLALCPNKLKSVDAEAWKKSLEVATYAVLDREKFKKDTDEITMHHYASKIEPTWASSKKLERHLSVGGLPIDSMKCLKLYSDKTSQKFDWQALQDVAEELQWYYAQNF